MSATIFRRFAFVLLALASLGAAGCTTIPSLLDECLAVESEKYDRIGFIDNDASAKDYMVAFEPMAQKRLEQIKEKLSDLFAEIEKDKDEKFVWALILTGDDDESLATLQARIKAVKPGMKLNDGELQSIRNKVPTQKDLKRYQRESIALGQVHVLQVNRLRGLIESEEVKGRETANLKRVFEVLTKVNWDNSPLAGRKKS